MSLSVQIACFAVLPVLSVVVALATFSDQHRIGLDFTTAYEQAKLVTDGVSPYASPDTDVSGGSIGAWPITAILPAVPLTLLPRGVAIWVATCIALATILATLLVLGVRDWRVFGLLLLWAPAIDAYQTANVSAALGLLVALAWRYRDRPIVAGAVLGISVALKFFLWPVVAWFAVTRRMTAAVIALILAVASLLLVLPFTSFGDYARLVRNLSETFDQASYTPFALLVGLGLPDAPAKAITIGFGLAVFALAWHRRSLTLAIATAFILSPIIWRHYFIVLAVPMAISFPRLHPAWAIPLAFWLVPGTYNGGTWQVAVALATAAAALAAAELRRPVAVALGPTAHIEPKPSSG
ncbi:MAG TPA: glycosyltransferase 87 family protein [Candidatus Limnocylindrales bacterium]|nr:glycosyltransferase 87 family protein [Candidatus Limnocylindrales bacterium]